MASSHGGPLGHSRVWTRHLYFARVPTIFRLPNVNFSVLAFGFVTRANFAVSPTPHLTIGVLPTPEAWNSRSQSRSPSRLSWTLTW